MGNIESLENTRLGHLLSKKMEEKNHKCLSENTISEFIENKLPLDKKEKVFEHLNSCGDCFDVYEIASSLINNLKKEKKKDFIKPLSIAASIIFVFLIGFYYSNFYKPESTNIQTYQKRDTKSISSLEETSRMPQNSLSFSTKEKKKQEKPKIQPLKKKASISREKREKGGNTLYSKPDRIEKKQMIKEKYRMDFAPPAHLQEVLEKR